MPFTGRLTDRMGGDRVVWVGCIVMAIATLPLAWVTSGTPQALVAALLFVRGLDLGGALMPSMAAAHAPLTAAEVPRATSALNAVQRVGGSLGTALVAVVLTRQPADALPGGGSTDFTEVPVAVRDQFAGPLATAFRQSVALALAGRARRARA
jgi:predicted MFS family arabinose efflux permease